MKNGQVLSLLLHGPSKAGKSSISFTGPFPMLCLDAEGSTKFIRTRGYGSKDKIRKITWDPMMETAPVPDGTWEVCVVNVSNWQQMRMVKQRLDIEPHGFASMSLDSITELQRKCKANMGKAATMQQQDWGMLLHEMDTLIRGFRDLLLLDNTLQVVTFIAESWQSEKNGKKWTPKMQGAIETSLPYWVDICGYVTQAGDEEGNPQVTMAIRNHPTYEAGERVQGILPVAILNPDITDILYAVYN